MGRTDACLLEAPPTQLDLLDPDFQCRIVSDPGARRHSWRSQQPFGMANTDVLDAAC